MSDLCRVNRNQILAALSSGLHDLEKNRRTPLKRPLRLTETGWIILNHIWLRRGGAVERRKKNKKGGKRVDASSLW